MRIKPFITEPVESPFDLGGLEFYGHNGLFLKEHYVSKDLQMIFISISVFSFNMRTKNKYDLSSNIRINYDGKKELFFVNDLLIEKISYSSLIIALAEMTQEALNILNKAGVLQQDAVLKDLEQDYIEFKKYLCNQKN